MAFEKEINDYENLRRKYQTVVIDRMDREEYRQFNEILFSTHSCAIEGNSFSVDDTRELKEKGLGMIPTGKSLLEAFEMLDHFKAYEYVLNNTCHALDEAFLKEINRLVTLHTLAYRSPDATPGEYTTTDMAAGDTVFGDHEQLVAKVPQLLASTERAIASSAAHPVVLAARFHGFYEYLHPFRDGNGRTGRLCGHKRSKHECSKALRVLFFLSDLIGHSRHCHLEEKADKVLIGAFGAYRAQGGYIFLAA